MRKSRKVLLALVLMALSAGTAFAVWQQFTGHSGSVGGKADQPSIIGALTLTADTTGSTLGVGEKIAPGATTPAAFTISNAAGVSETIATATAGPVTSSGGAPCSSHVGAVPGVLVGLVSPAGETNAAKKVAGFWAADSTLPNSCANATFSVTVSGTTTP
jgi:hypothetical protein